MIFLVIASLCSLVRVSRDHRLSFPMNSSIQSVALHTYSFGGKPIVILLSFTAQPGHSLSCVRNHFKLGRTVLTSLLSHLSGRLKWFISHPRIHLVVITHIKLYINVTSGVWINRIVCNLYIFSYGFHTFLIWTYDLVSCFICRFLKSGPRRRWYISRVDNFGQACRCYWGVSNSDLASNIQRICVWTFWYRFHFFVQFVGRCRIWVSLFLQASPHFCSPAAPHSRTFLSR